MPGRTAKFEVFESVTGGLWYWHLRARNGEIVAQSEAYSTRSSARRAVNRFKAIVAGAVIA